MSSTTISKSTPTVVLPAAGQNRRMFPLNTLEHKSLLTVGGQPLLIAALRDLADHGFQRAVVIQSQPVGSARLEQVVADHRLPIEVEFVQQAEPRGMGDAILRAGDQLEGPFCVVAPYQVRAGRITPTVPFAAFHRDTQFAVDVPVQVGGRCFRRLHG